MSDPTADPPGGEQQRFRRVDALFDAALDLETSKRAPFVQDSTVGDSALRDEVLALLRAHERSHSFLATPATIDARLLGEIASGNVSSATDPLLVRLQSAIGDAYQLRRPIGVGGMAVVYLAEDVRHQRLVAVKVFASREGATVDATRGAERFLAEIRVMARLQHSHILPLFDSGAAGGLLYYVMPFVSGETLRQRLQREAPLSTDEALRLTHAITGGLAHAHAEGVVHRDLKPENILLRGGEPLIADFGIALALSGVIDPRMTHSGMLVGTPRYMSPEQATGEQTLDARTDIYSLGAMLYEMLVGDPPHVASSAQGVLAKVRSERPTSVHLLRPGVPLAVSAVIDRALAKQPADRFATVSDFDAALTRAVAAPARRPVARFGWPAGALVIAHNQSGPGARTGELAVVTLDPGATTPSPFTRLGVIGRRAVGYVDGWLLYTAGNGTSVMAVRFDVAKRRVDGAPVRVLEDAAGGIDVATLASNGTLLYTRQQTANSPVLVDTSGTSTPMLAGVSGAFMNPRLSPDGGRLVMQSTSAQGNDVMSYDLATRTPSRVTTLGTAVGPAWTPDGRHVVFFSTRNGRDEVWQESIDGSSPPEQLIAADGIFAVSVSPDGRRLIFQRIVNGVWGVWYAERFGDHTPQPVVVGPFDAFMPALSPDGRRLAYASNETGRYEVYVRPFPGPGVAVQVSQEGGTEPAWSPDRRRIFFRGDRRMHVANVSEGLGLTVTDRRVLFTEAFDGDMPMPHRNYDVTPDGHHFVMIAATGAAPQTIVVLAWLEELRARLRSATRL